MGLGSCTEWICAWTYYHWAIAQQGQLGRCPRLTGIPLPQGPMTPPPYPPVTAAASTQATILDPPRGGGGRPRAESQPRKRDAATAGVQGAAWSTGGCWRLLPPGVAEENLESPALHGAPSGNAVDPSLGGRIPARQFRSPSRTTKADSRPFGRCMKRPEETGWPLR